ncbi:MAG: hypothetical protein HZA53_04570 [Planctomycetes bacterium]|nr:hypothetical protein [Planctomycetota bacterium]
MHRTHIHPLQSALAASLLALAACSPGADDAFAKERVYQPIGTEVQWGATTAERFRLDRSDFKGARAPEPGGLHWTTPQGWSELPTTSMRVANFRVAGDERAECYLTVLAGEGGGLDANVNRWRTQMAAAPLSPQDVAALPRIEWFGLPSVLVEIDGTWSGMSGDKSGADFRMVGLLLVDPSGSKFLKMVGPRELVAKEQQRFVELAASFHEGGQDDHDAHAANVAPDAQRTMPKDAVHGAIDDGMPMPSAGGSSSFAWTAPAGWTQGPEKAMREVTFLAGGKREVECYVTALGGDGGGLASNLNRWRQQMGRAPLGADEIDALSKVAMLGAQATVVEIEKEGGGDMVLGAVCLQPDRSVFVKMLGPKAAVEAERAAFLEFCKSIRSGR